MNEIVCLCGSTRFEKEFANIARKFTLEGKIILTVHVFRHNEILDAKQLIDLDALHLHKIEIANRVHIVNIDGYVGEGTAREIAYAQSLSKSITYEVQ